MNKVWAGTTYGNSWMHKWLTRMLRVIDVRILYAFVSIFIIPVCLILNPSRGIAYRYFRKRQGYSRFKSAWKTYVNHCLFGQVVVDRFAAYAGKQFLYEIEGYDTFRQLASRPEGFLQLSAHVGNYEMAGYELEADQKKFCALVFFGEKESVMKSRKQMFERTGITMIPVRPDMGHLFDINEALIKGCTVSMPADRLFGSTKSITLPFLGAEADFPVGPFSVAAMRGLDVLSVNVVKEAWNRFRIIVRPLSYDKTASRREQIQSIARSYVEELERIVNKYPDQWYNYFEFWKAND